MTDTSTRFDPEEFRKLLKENDSRPKRAPPGVSTRTKLHEVNRKLAERRRKQRLREVEQDIIAILSFAMILFLTMKEILIG